MIFALVYVIGHIHDAVLMYSLEHIPDVLHFYTSQQYAIANDVDLIGQHSYMTSPNDNFTTGAQQPVIDPSAGSAPVQGTSAGSPTVQGPSVGSAPAQNPSGKYVFLGTGPDGHT
jgi:hypothetical protein